MDRSKPRSTDIDKLLSETEFEFLFRNDIFKHIADFLEKQGGIVRKLITTLESTKQYETQHFWTESGRPNFLTLLYLLKKKVQEASELCTETREHDVKNLTAILCQIKISERQMRPELSAAIKAYNEIKENKQEMTKQKLICAGEIAFVCTLIGPLFYEEAFERYEKLLARYSEILSSGIVSLEDIGDRVCCWRYYLAQTYCRIFNRGNAKKLETHRLTVQNVFDKISQHLKMVIDSKNHLYEASAMIDMVDSYKKYCDMTDKKRRVAFPRAGGLEVCVKQAMDLAIAHRDTYCLERCARHYRQKAGNNDEKGLRFAIEICRKTLEICPTKHVAVHQMGLAYRSLWQYSIEKDHNYNEIDMKMVTRSAMELAISNYPNLPTSNSHKDLTEDDAGSIQHQKHIKFEFNGPKCSTVNFTSDINTGKLPKTPLTAPPCSRKYCEFGVYCPMQAAKQAVGLRDYRRSENPPSSDREHKEFLIEAKECFEKANMICKSSSNRYLVDLARTLISLEEYDEAEKRFREANCLMENGTVDDNNACYMYEQWALMKQKLAMKSSDDAELEMAMSLHRLSVRAAIRAGIRSRISFYELRRMLHEKLVEDESDMVVKLECQVLFEKQNEFKLTDALGEDTTLLATTWEMIEILYERKYKNDADTAFTYLTALRKSGKLDLDEDGVCSRRSQVNPRSMVLEIMRRISVQKNHLPAARKVEVYHEVFSWLVESKSTTADHDVVVLAPKEDTPGTQRIINLLEQKCRVSPLKIFIEGDDDILPGDVQIEAMYEMLKRSRAVIVVENGADECWNDVTFMFPHLLKLSGVRVCLVVDSSLQDNTCIEEIYLKSWPRFILNNECSDDCLVYSLFKTILLCNRK